MGNSGENSVTDDVTGSSSGDVTDSSSGDTEQHVRSISHSLLVLFGAFLAAALVQQSGMAVLETAGLVGDGTPLVLEVAPMALHFVGFLLVAVAYLDWRNDRSLVRFGWPTRHHVRWTLLGFSGLVALLFGLEFVLSVLGLEPADNVSVQAGLEHPRLFLYFIPVVLFLNAPAEELLFRGIIQGLFRRAYGVVPAVFAAALVFGLVHWVALVGTGSRLAYVAIAFVSGLVLGALYEYTENLFVPIAVHACWNTLVYLTLYIGALDLI